MYTIYHDGGDTEVFERPDGTKDRNEFVFAGFGNFIHPYHKKQLSWASEMLASAGIFLHIRQVPTVNDIGSNADRGYFEIEDLKSITVKPASNCRNLVLIQDGEMGRGWAVLMEIKSDNTSEILYQDHRDTIRDTVLLDEEWLNEQGVKFTRKEVKNIEKIK